MDTPSECPKKDVVLVPQFMYCYPVIDTYPAACIFIEQSGQYVDWDDFHSDMLLVRDNCHLYNPPGHEVRRDCDEVFAFYHMEYEKTLEKWQKVNTVRKVFFQH